MFSVNSTYIKKKLENIKSIFGFIIIIETLPKKMRLPELIALNQSLMSFYSHSNKPKLKFVLQQDSPVRKLNKTNSIQWAMMTY